MCSESSQQIYDISDGRDDNDETRRLVENWLGVDSIIAKPNEKIREKSIARNFACRPSNCPTYVVKNSCQNDWEGKILKLKLSEACCSSSKKNQPKTTKLSKLRLPCEFQNVISKFDEADSVIIGLSSVTRRKKFRADLVNVCRKINQIFSKVDKNEVRRCKLHCEKFPNYLSLKITKRKPDGCKVCLLTDRLLINKFEDRSMSGSRESSFSKLSQIMEDENSRDSYLTFRENSEGNLDVAAITKIPKSQERIDPNFFETYLEPRKSTDSRRSIDVDVSNQSTESGPGEETCNCDTVDPPLDQINRNENNAELDFRGQVHGAESKINSNEPIRKDSSKLRYDNRFQGQTCNCNESFVGTVDDVVNNLEKNPEPDRIDESNPNQNIEENVSLKKTSFPSSAVDFDSQACFCNARDSLAQGIDKVSKNSLPTETPIRSMDHNIQSPERSKAPTPRASGMRLERGQILQSKAFIELPQSGWWLQPVATSSFNLPSREPSRDPATKESSIRSMEPKPQIPKKSEDLQSPKESSVQRSDDKLDTGVCPCSFPREKSVQRLVEKDKIDVNEEKTLEYPGRNVGDSAATKQRVSNELSCLFDSRRVNDPIDMSSFDMVAENRVENHCESLKVDLDRCKSFTKIPVHNKNEIPNTPAACECPSDCLCANKQNLDVHADDRSCQNVRQSLDDQGPSKLFIPAIKRSRNRNVSNQMSKSRCDGLITQSLKTQSNSVETQVGSKEFRISGGRPDPRDRSLASLSVSTKGTSRPFQKMAGNAMKCFEPEESLKTNISCEKLLCERPPLFSAKFPRPKGQRINISIELCPESDGSFSKVEKRDKKSVRTLHIDSTNLRHCNAPESRTLLSLRQLEWQSVDLGNRGIRVNQPSGKNVKGEWPGETNSRMHSPVQPLESRDYLPPVERVDPSMRNTSVYENPMKSGLRSNGKFEKRSITQSRRIFQDYETREFHEPIRNNHRWDKNITRQMQSRGNKDFSRSSRNSARFSSSFVNGHLCHAFSSSSIDRMRHLIKTKLRRILLERDKSTNTPKTSLTNKKYRVSFPKGKTIERSPFQGKCCRTIWESHSASDSTPASRSFVSENRTEIPEGADMCQLLYCSSKRSKKSSSNFESISRDSDFSKNDTMSIDSLSDSKKTRSNDSAELDYTKERPVRLAGGSDFIPHQKIPAFGDFTSRKNSATQFSRMRHGNPEFSTNREKKLFAHSRNCELPENLENYSDPLDSRGWDSPVSRKENEQEFIARSGKLESSLKSTSRHIYFYEFPNSPNDEFFGSNLRVKKKRQSVSKVRLPQKPENKIDRKVKIKENAYGKNSHECEKRSTLHRDTNPLNISSPANTTTPAHKSFNYLDSDLRSKLLQYVSLCKNVKYSLLKRLRASDAYEVSGTSISCGDHL